MTKELPPEYYAPEYSEPQPQPYDYSPVMNAPDATFARQVDPKNILDEIKHIIRGDQWDGDKEIWEITKEPMINAKGIKSIMSLLYPIVNQNTTLSEFKSDEITALIISIMDRVVVSIATSGEDWGIEKQNYPIIISSLRVILFSTLKRAQEGGERKLWRTTIKSTDQRIINPNIEHKGGFFSKLFK